MEEALHDIPMLREFAGLDAGEDAMPDETTILKFRHLLEAHALAPTLFDETAALLAEKGLLLRQGTIVDATLIAAPPSTKNRERKRDPEMTSTKKGNNYYFGMKAPIGVDAESGLVHTVAVTTAKVADGVMTDALVHGEEQIVLGDRAYTRNDRNPDAEPGRVGMYSCPPIIAWSRWATLRFCPPYLAVIVDLPETAGAAEERGIAVVAVRDPVNI